MPDPSPSTLTVLNSNFLQLGRRSGGRPQRTVCPVNCDTHYLSRHRTHNLLIVSLTRYQLCYRDHRMSKINLCRWLAALLMFVGQLSCPTLRCQHRNHHGATTSPQFHFKMTCLLIKSTDHALFQWCGASRHCLALRQPRGAIFTASASVSVSTPPASVLASVLT